MVKAYCRGRTGLSVVQGMARSGSGLRAHRVNQGSAAAAMGSDGGGGSSSGLLWGTAAQLGQGSNWRKQPRGSGH